MSVNCFTLRYCFEGQIYPIGQLRGLEMEKTHVSSVQVLDPDGFVELVQVRVADGEVAAKASGSPCLLHLLLNECVGLH